MALIEEMRVGVAGHILYDGCAEVGGTEFWQPAIALPHGAGLYVFQPIGEVGVKGVMAVVGVIPLLADGNASPPRPLEEIGAKVGEGTDAGDSHTVNTS